MPICRQCNTETDDFYASNRSRCKACVRAKVRQYRQENIERVKEYDRKRGQLPHRKAAVRARAHRYAGKYKDAFTEANPEKRAAHVAAGNAIRSGRLKALPCERCGYAVGVQAHHEDYSKPLDVIWLCTRCHGERHREINEERRRTG